MNHSQIRIVGLAIVYFASVFTVFTLKCLPNRCEDRPGFHFLAIGVDATGERSNSRRYSR